MEKDVMPVLEEGVFSKVISRRLVKQEPVYCMSVDKNRNLVANGIVSSNCDALRYALFTAFGKKKNLKWGEDGGDGRSLGNTRQF